MGFISGFCTGIFNIWDIRSIFSRSTLDMLKVEGLQYSQLIFEIVLQNIWIFIFIEYSTSIKFPVPLLCEQQRNLSILDGYPSIKKVLTDYFHTLRLYVKKRTNHRIKCLKRELYQADHIKATPRIFYVKLCKIYIYISKKKYSQCYCRENTD